MAPSAIVVASSSTARRLTGTREFSWGAIRKGGGTMLDGAKWTLRSDGGADFDGAVTSETGGGAWVIWHVDLLDTAGEVLGSLSTEHPVDGDWRKFVRSMPGSAQQYRFRATATFDARLWNDIARLRMHCSC